MSRMAAAGARLRRITAPPPEQSGLTIITPLWCVALRNVRHRLIGGIERQ